MFRTNGGRKLVLVVWLLAAAGAACDSPPAPSALSASPVVAAVTIAGPTTIEPDTTARYSATARYTDGSTRDVTELATWFSVRRDIVDVSAGGTALARSRGETQVRAQYGALSLPVNVMVLENGTFRLSGRVTDADTGKVLPGAAVEVLDGIGAGLRATADGNGTYFVYGVAADVRLAVSADGWATRTEALTVTAATTRDYVLTPVPPSFDLTGTWRMTIEAVPECTLLPEAARSRQFAVSIAHAGSQFVARASSPSLRVSDDIKGRVLGGAFLATLFFWPGDVVDLPEYGLLDALEPRGLLGIFGTINATIGKDRIDGVLDGGLHYYQNVVAFGAQTGCDGRSAAVRLVRE